MSPRVPEKNDIAFLHHVLLAFQAHLPFFAGRRPASRREQVFAAHDLGANEVPLDVGVNRRPPPSPRVVPRRMVHARTSGSPAVKNEISPSSSYVAWIKRCSPGCFQSVRGQKLGPRGVVKLGQFRFDAPANRHDRALRPAQRVSAGHAARRPYRARPPRYRPGSGRTASGAATKT